MTTISFLVPIVLLATQLINFWLKHKYNISEESQPFNHKQKIVNRVYIFLFVIVIILLFLYSSMQVAFLAAAGIATLYAGYEALFDYMHAQEERQYIFHFVRMVGYAMIFFGILYITQNITPIEEIVQDEGQFDAGKIEHLKIENSTWNGKRENERMITIEDPQLINRLFNTLFKLEVRERLEWKGNLDENYTLHTPSQPIYYFDISDKWIEVDFTTCEIVGENRIYEILEDKDVDWENAANY
ncbi:DUF4181 domain-containing protein [Oceanobacillus kapialis]|uniref:DUF4181 domain-containing protein n=1 Tax=Oceanobacillus kapialis TaxID=481353 RepID=UPI00384B7430